MSAFVAAYLIVWMAVVLYVARLGTRQRRLARDLEALELQLDHSRVAEDSVSRAA